LKSSKIFGVILAFLFTLSAVYAIQYDINLNVAPFGGTSDKAFLVFGHISSKDDSRAILSSDLKIEIVNPDGDVIYSTTPSYVDLSSGTFVFNGYFYKIINIYNPGDYIVRVVAGDSKEFKLIHVDDMDVDKKVGIKIVDYAVDTEGNIKIGFNIQNKDSLSHDIRVTLVSDNGGMTYLDTSVGGDSEILVDKTYSVSTLGDNKFLLVAVAQALDEEGLEYMSNPSYVNVNVCNASEVHNRDLINITGIEFSRNTFFPGDLVVGEVKLKNIGTTAVQYKFEYMYNNQLYVKSSTGFIQPGETAIERVYIDVPNTSQFNLTLKVFNSNFETTVVKNILVSQRTKQFFIALPEKIYSVNSSGNVTLNVEVYNTGNLKDTYFVNVTNWSNYEIKNSTFVLSPGEEGNVSILFVAPQHMRVGGYHPHITVRNIDGSCKSKQVEIDIIKSESEQTIVVWNDSQDYRRYIRTNTNLTYTFSIKNIGNVEKTYDIEINAPEGVNYSIDTPITLGVDEERNISFNITPIVAGDYNITLNITTNGEEVFSKEFSISQQVTTFTGMFVSGISGAYVPGLIILALLGVATLGYFGYVGLTRYIWTKKVLDYTRSHPKRLTGY
jgi:hypothetical protein